MKQRYKRWLKSPLAKRLKRRAKQPKFAATYLIGSLMLLFATTLLWSLLGAGLQQSNADQLANPYLLQDSATFHGAQWPDQHSFLLKWPLFWLVKLLGSGTAAYVGVTVCSVLLTVGGLVYILSRIERRPLVLGSLCLALASVLLLVPAQPYPGGLLPVNLAMLTTRNLEYIWYIGSLYAIVTAARLRSRRLVGGVVLLGLLVASDHLFLSVSLVGAFLALVAYVLRQRWTLVSLSMRWLLASGVAIVVALGIVAGLNHAGVTHIVAASSAAGPYSLIDRPRGLFLGILYAFGGLLTNFGANPAAAAQTLGQMLGTAWHQLLGIAGPAYLVNLGLFVIGITLCLRFLYQSLWSRQPAKSKAKANLPIVAPATSLSLVLIWATVAIIGLFIITDHYYVVDARYLALSLFTVFVVVATWARGRRVDVELLLIASPVLLLAIICGSLTVLATNHTEQQALDGINRRNKIVAQTLSSHHVSVLVGDYWRVLPTKLVGGGKQIVLPLEDCTKPRTVLTSTAWQPDLHRHSFAYLLTLDGSLTDYPNCTLSQAIEGYGLPNSSALIDGTLAHPKELLLFYDQGIHPPRDKAILATHTPATVLPVRLDDVMHTTCKGPSVVNVVAHQDDDLLFMNPDLLTDIQAGHCVRSVYLTAGDAGADAPYWLAREQGSEAAYGQMLGGAPVSWVKRIVKLSDGQFVTISSPRGNDRISLIFMHLPDGNLKGEGFGASRHQSLARLEAGQLGRIDTVDRQSHYTVQQLTAGLVELLQAYQPGAIHTQSDFGGQEFPDHSDHQAAGNFARQALVRYEHEQFADALTVPLTSYMGYPVRELSPNLSGTELDAKEAAFAAYARYDGSVCHSAVQCAQVPTYGSYLDRQYTDPY